MKRSLSTFLKSWKEKKDKKPILLRGARQVGKSYVVKDFARFFNHFAEINFEFEPDLKQIFELDLNPERIIRDLSIATGKVIRETETLLFFDEIQECPNAIKSLRYFYEKMPGLHVIAAGSLLEFILEEIGIPVGRITPLHLYPLSFLEFLDAKDETLLKEALINHTNTEELPVIFHKKLTNLFGEYMEIGGMPEAVNKWISDSNIHECLDIHRSIINTYKQDFLKYAKKRQIRHVQIVFNSIPLFVGQKIIFSSISKDFRSRELKPALDLLKNAGVLHVIQHTSSNVIPLGAEVNPSVFKALFLDVALMQSILGVEYSEWILNPIKCISNSGMTTEAFVGQELLAYSNPTEEKELYYWVREKKQSMAEVDYVTTIDGTIIPIEVKSTHPHKIKSIQVFLEKKIHSPYGIVFSQANFLEYKNLKLLPLYAVHKAVR